MNKSNSSLDQARSYQAPFFYRVTIVLFIGFIFRVAVSCKPPPPAELVYNFAELVGVDNSGRGPRSARYEQKIDTMYRDALALGLLLYDSSDRTYAANSSSLSDAFSFSSATALSLDFTFRPIRLVNNIRIFTLMDIDNTSKAGDNVTANFYFGTDNSPGLYVTLNTAIEKLNGIQSYDKGWMQLFLNKRIENNLAQFRIEVDLNDGSTLYANSDTITILTP